MQGFVLAGGQSTRMGRDKALVELAGHPLIALAMGKLRALGLEPRICGSRADLKPFGEVLPDRFPGSGPLAGIEAALAASEADLNLFLPVDVPLVPVEFLRWMAERAEASGAAATVPVAEGREQPLCAVYSRRLQPCLRAALEAGNCKVMRAVRQSAEALGQRVDAFAMESVAAALPADRWPSSPPLRCWFHNANTPADLARWNAGLQGTSPPPSA